LANERPTQRLLPRALGQKLGHLPLPRWVAECCGLHQNASVSDLAAVSAPSANDARGALEFYVSELVKSRASEIADTLVFPPSLIVDGKPIDAARWPTRPRNALAQVGVLEDRRMIETLTYGQLFKLNGVGVKTVVEVGLRAEELVPRTAAIQSAPEEPAILLVLEDSAIDSLRALAAADWADLVHGSDPRFADLMPNNGVSLADLAESILSHCAPTGAATADSMRLLPGHLQSLPAIRAWLREVQDRVSHLETLKLEDVLSDFVERCSSLRGKRRDALLARLGWSGKPSLTLEESGRLLDVTRERIRQIENSVREKFPTTPAYFPALSRALELLAEVAPIGVDKAADLLQARGVSRGKFSPESVIAAANTLGIDAPIQVASAKGVRLVTRAANTAHVSAILVIARKKAGASGVASAHDIAAGVTGKSGLACSVEDVTKTLEASRHFRHLRGPWYWATDLPTRRNRLVNVCTNMLSVTSPISISSLRDGIKREYTFRNLSGSGRVDLRVPPVDVLRDFLRDHPDFVVEDNDGVRPRTPLDYRKLLGQTDQVLVDVLRSSPSTVLDRATIVRECVERGTNPQTVQVDLTYSCLVEHIDTNIWTLRGSDVNPAAVEALRRSNALRPKEKRVRDFGWTADGSLWIAAVVPPITQPFVFGCPPGSRAFLAGQSFHAALRDSTPCGNVRITEDGMAYGLGTFQQVSGCDPGDIVVVEFNLSDRQATLILGDEELLDRYTAE
jgi:hypothetical protein